MSRLTLWRRLLYKKVANIELGGEVLDLGGMRNADYQGLFKGTNKIYVANYGKGDMDYNFDFEKKFPIPDNKFNFILSFNVLEHIFNYNNVLSESNRILKENGKLIMTTPFLFQKHPCPNDYWRFTKECLYKILQNNGFGEIEIKEIGTGIFSTIIQLKTGLFKFFGLYDLAIKLGLFFDKLFREGKRGSGFTKEYYPIGYLVIAKKVKV